MRVNWPHPILFPNAHRGRSHWAYQSKKKEARKEGFYAAKQSGISAPIGKLSLNVHFYEPNRRRRDLDGMLGAVKSHIDGICDALEIDDSNFIAVVLERSQDPEKKGYVEFSIGRVKDES